MAFLLETGKKLQKKRQKMELSSAIYLDEVRELKMESFQ